MGIKKEGASNRLRLAVVTPTYNEAGNIGKLLHGIKRATRKLEDVDVNVLVIDDSSPDGTAKKVEQLAPKLQTANFSVSVLVRTKKDGLGRAYIYGFKHVLKSKLKPDFVLQMDADLSHNPAYIPKFIAQAREGAEFVTASRYVPGGGTPDWGLFRKLLSRGGNFYTKVILGRRISDYTGGYNLYSANLLQRINLNSLRAGGYGFLIELKHRALTDAKKIAEIPIVFMDRTHGTSKIPKSTLLKSFFLVLHIKNYHQQQIRSRFRWQRVLLETWPIVMLTLLMLVVMKHISLGPWKSMLLYNGDSTVLPLVFDSFAKHEPFQWVFSSQLFIFPEALLYAVADLFTATVRSALMLNAVINILIFYAASRVIVHFSVQRSNLWRVVISLLIPATFLLYVLLERTVDVGRSSIATPFLFTTYYSGIILSSVSVLALMLWQTRGLRRELTFTRKNSVVGLAIAAIVFLTTFANPLFIMQFTFPLLLALLLMYVLNKIKLRTTLIFVAINFLPVVVAYKFRGVFSEYIAASVGSYVQPERIHISMHVLKISVNEMKATPTGQLKLVGIGAFMMLAVLFVLHYMYATSRRAAKSEDAPRLFLASFILISSLTIVIGFLATGSITTRYFLPLLMFPLFSYALVDSWLPRLRLSSRVLAGVLTLVTIAVLIPALGSVRATSRMARGYEYTAADCLSQWAGGRTVHGVGDFWSTRELTLYGPDNVTTLQLTDQREVFEWMINVGSYKNKHFTFALDDRGLGPASTFFKPSIDVLGTPASVTHCPTYDIYDFTNTPGEKVLNKNISDSLKDIHERRGF